MKQLWETLKVPGYSFSHEKNKSMTKPNGLFFKTIWTPTGTMLSQRARQFSWALESTTRTGQAFFIKGTRKLLRFSFKTHVVFYEERDDKILIIRILGKRMDFKRHL